MKYLNIPTNLKKYYGINTILIAFIAAACLGCGSVDTEPEPSTGISDNTGYTGTELENGESEDMGTEDQVLADTEMGDTDDAQTGEDAENIQNNADTVRIHNFEQEEVAVIPEVQEYDFDTAVQMGEVQELVGTIPGASPGRWYIVEIEGVEYYYSRLEYIPGYSGRAEVYGEYELSNWSIIDDSYELANGLKVGMTEEEILEQYPDMAVVDFESNYINGAWAAFMGWNGTAYPSSYTGMDSNWDYEGKDYYNWEDQFDYVMVANIDLHNIDTLPKYIGLLIKDHTVAAITFYYPTAG